MARKPKVTSKGEQELKKAEAQLEKFQDQVKSLSVDTVSKAPAQETEPQTKLSKKEIDKLDAPYIKPTRAIFSTEKFNEAYRKERDEGWKYVKCIVENNEIHGEKVEKWTKRWPGEPAHFWQIPVNKPIYLPKFVAEELQGCSYHRFVMQSRNPDQVREGEPMEDMVAKETRHRIDCRSVGFGELK